jgi:hypothetical protein
VGIIASLFFIGKNTFIVLLSIGAFLLIAGGVLELLRYIFKIKLKKKRRFFNV